MKRYGLDMAGHIVVTPIGDYYLASDVAAELERGNRAMRELERLTPQGSEFHNDPEFCAKYIRQSWDDDRKLLKDIVLNRKQIRAELAKRDEVIRELLVIAKDAHRLMTARARALVDGDTP